MTLQHDDQEDDQNGYPGMKQEMDQDINIDDIMPFETTEEISIPFHLVDQVIGQDEAVEVVRKAAIQRRNVLLIGDPGTGKSMLGQALAELLPREELEDILCLPNPNDPQNPRIMVVPSLEGRKIVEHYKEEARRGEQFQNMITIAVPLGIFLLALSYFFLTLGTDPTVLFLGIFTSIFALMFFGQTRSRKINLIPKLLVDTTDQSSAPFADATGAHAGALLGDVRHDPFQCIPGSQRIHMPNGKSIPVKDIVDPIFDKLKAETTTDELDLPLSLQFEVLGGYDSTYCYDAAKVSKVYRRYYTGNLVQIRTERGHVILVTPEHPIASLKDGKVIYHHAKSIKEADIAILPHRYPITAANKRLPIEFVLLLADLLADGHIKQRSIEFKLKKEFKIQSITSDIQHNKLKPKIRSKGNLHRIDINSSKFIKYLVGLGVKDQHGKKSIPSILYSQPKEIIETFLIRYLSLDGYVDKQGQFELYSKEMIPDLTVLLLKIGIIPNIRDRLDPGFAKGKIQRTIYFSNYMFAVKYSDNTINPTHKRAVQQYIQGLKKIKPPRSPYHSTIPIPFELLEKIRKKAGLSKNKTHREYYLLNPTLPKSKTLTRPFLKLLVSTFRQSTNCQELAMLDLVANGSYAFDKIVRVKELPYEGFVYNLTTSTGNYIVNNVLTHNSGGLGTPAHTRVEAGLIHKSHKGVLYIDEVATLAQKTQQQLLTAMQEKKLSITGRSELSSGAMVMTEAVPSDFVLVASGNVETVRRMHPALRSRIRGYGYEVFMRNNMPDSKDNREKLVRFIAQEVSKDGKIPHFSKEGVIEILREGKRRAGRKKRLTLRLRDLGGLIRAAGDLAREEGTAYVEAKHVLQAKDLARSLENQIADRYVEERKDYDVILNKGAIIGRVNGLYVTTDPTGGARAGGVTPIAAKVTPGAGKIVATGKLRVIARESVQNVSALIKAYTGIDISKRDVHVQFLGTYGVEGDSASITIATAIVSDLEELPVKQNIAMTGSLSIRGEVLPVGGVSAKIEGAYSVGVKEIIIPYSNLQDIVLEKAIKEDVKIYPVKTLMDVLSISLEGWKEKGKSIGANN